MKDFLIGAVMVVFLVIFWHSINDGVSIQVNDKQYNICISAVKDK